ncbi:hypothetical protein NEOLEDRAFT_1065494 [Neolentinus lepideus HHB14362 ss-1]|uniref:BTB domain-containing protein n=1 Tax=Neolentinus lepideus HHB14362 ss-1 TaxID=1314782 RepID=A0A165SKY0_9AGAM|nr:hypothetical protein NEOLEDRAFT_1065494 [Neolentinus lepideus HHB14362 ss-1]
MSLLHAYFHLRNQQAFQRLLDGSSGPGQASSPSGGRSWSHKGSSLKEIMVAEVNARDAQGRTVLHLACASQEASAPEYVRMLLAHPAINVNLQDMESHWTALHRALYHGNLTSAILLLQRSDTDTLLKDLEGYTAFDLYNSTLEDTKPSLTEAGRLELSTWGANRNATLGLGDSNDRAYPEQVAIRRADAPDTEKRSLDHTLSPIHVWQVQMSRLHTVVVTDEPRNNLRVCGFGSGGRLGPGQHTQYSFTTIPHFNHTIVSVALGQDHTLALTASGEVLSWGLNRFAQLGYVIEQPTSVTGRLEEPIQASPRKILGPLRKEFVRGVAACKTASACWTDTEAYSWGTNGGQLGYSSTAHPTQVLPRIVSKFTDPVEAIAMTDTAMACLLSTKDVVLLFSDRSTRITFPNQNFPPEFKYRPPQTNAKIIKIVASWEGSFAALSTNGEVFTFNVPTPNECLDTSSTKGGAVKPQRVWALRKQFSAVKDVALGSDGSIIICTESGHVFVRSRNLKSGQGSNAKAFKFQCIPYLQRVVRVAANSTGAFGALRVDYVPKPVVVIGNDLAQDLTQIQPYLSFPDDEGESAGDVRSPVLAFTPDSPEHDEGEDFPILKDIKDIKRLCRLLALDRKAQKAGGRGLFADVSLAHGANLMVQVNKFEFPVHAVILSARALALAEVISSKNSLHDKVSGITIKSINTKMGKRLSFTGCQAMTALVFVSYIYSDELFPLWDGRVSHSLKQEFTAINIVPQQVKQELQALARMLELPSLSQALDAPAKRVPAPTVNRDMERLYHSASVASQSPLSADVILVLADREVSCHSAILRARSPFFASFFDEEDWARNRWNQDGTVVVHMKHLTWRVMQHVLRFLCCGSEDVFNQLDFVNSVDDLLEFAFELVAAASELLLDRLILICSSVILRHININNACYILTDASHYNAHSLVRSIQGYMAVTLETLLESCMLDDLRPDLIKQLSKFVRDQQLNKSPVTRSNRLVNAALEKNAGWLTLQDFPQPIVRSNKGPLRDSVKLSPPGPTRMTRQLSGSESPLLRPSLPSTSSPRPPKSSIGPDEIFMMDDSESESPTEPVGLPADLAAAIAEPISSIRTLGGWKPLSSAPRLDMRSIMAEAESSKTSKLPQSNTTPKWTPKKFMGDSIDRVPTPKTPTRTSSVSPWKPVATSTATLITSPSTSPSGLSVTKSANPRAPASRPPPVQPSPQAPQSTLGPVYSPSRLPPPKVGASSSRRVSSGTAWSSPPVHPAVDAIPTASTLSFAAIQQMQMDQTAGSSKAKQTLRDIQEEEQARQQEEDFLKWWAAEEERVRLGMEGGPSTPDRKKPRSPRKPKPKTKGSEHESKLPKARGTDQTDDVDGAVEGIPRKERRPRGSRAGSKAASTNNSPPS